VKVQINNCPVTFEFEREETVSDVISSVSQWARERDLVFLETEIDEKSYLVDHIPDISLDDVDLINCFVQSRADVVISSLNEGISYCDRILSFVAQSIDNYDADLSPIKNLAGGIEWLLDVLRSVLQLLDVDINQLKYKDKAVAEYTDGLLHLKDFLETEEDVSSVKQAFSEGNLIESFKNIFKMILLSEDLRTLVVNSIDSPDLLIDSLNEIKLSASEQIKNLDDIVIAFQTGRDVEGSEKLNIFIDFTFRYIRACLQITPVFGIDLSMIAINSVNLEDRNRELHELLNEIVIVMENNDIISLTDVLEYEIKPVIEDLDQYIEQIQERIVDKN
jgi:hypothetical protein